MLNFELLDEKVEQNSPQVILDANRFDLQELYHSLRSRGYVILLDPSIEDLETRTHNRERVLILLPSLMDGYKEIVTRKRLRAVILTLDKRPTSKLGANVFSGVM